MRSEIEERVLTLSMSTGSAIPSAASGRHGSPGRAAMKSSLRRSAGRTRRFDEAQSSLPEVGR
jgi:hypothetical protein